MFPVCILRREHGIVKSDAIRRRIKNLPGHGVKQGGLNLRNPVTAAPWLRQNLVEATAAMVKSLLKGDDPNTVEHNECVKEARLWKRKDRVLAEEVEVTRQMARARSDVRKQLARIRDCGACITAVPDKLQVTLLFHDE